MSVWTGTSYPRSHPHLVYVVPVRDRQMIGELAILIHEVKLIPRQKHGRNQLHLQLCRLHPCTKVPTGSPTEERIDSFRDRVRSQPPTWVVLVWFGVVFGVQVDISGGIYEEISSSDHQFADFHLLMNVPPEGNSIVGNSV